MRPPRVAYWPSEPYLSSSRFPQLSEICSTSSKGKRAKSNLNVKWEAAHHKCIFCVYFLCLNTHNIKFTLFTLNLQFCAFSTFTLRNRHRHSRTFTHPKLKLCPYLTTTSPLPSPEAPVNPHPTFCLCEFDSSRDLIEVGSSSICPLWLAYFMEHHVLKVHPGPGMCQNSLHFWGWIMFHCMYISHFVYPLICWRTLGLLSSFSDCG